MALQPARPLAGPAQPHDPSAPIRRLIGAACSPAAVDALEPHMALLVNLGDVALASPSGEAGLRKFLAFVDALCTQCRNALDAAGYAEQHCEALRRQLHQEREGRNADGFRMVVGSLDQRRSLEAERQRGAGLEARLRALGSELDYALGMQRRQAAELQALMRTCAEAEVGMEARLREEVRRQQELMLAQQEHLKRHFEQQSTEAGRLGEALSAELVRERGQTQAAKEEAARLERSMEPWRLLQSARVPCVLELLRFLQQEGLELACAPLPVQRARVPVLALEWPPRTELDLAPAWPSLSEAGCLGLLARLCTGELRPEDLELTVSCVEGRWVGALHGELEAPRLGALLMFQGLRPDLCVAANCRVVPLRRPLLPKGVLELDPQRRCVPPVGVDAAGRPAGGRLPALSADPEAGLRAILRGCPIEEEVLSALCYVHAAYPKALQRAAA